MVKGSLFKALDLLGEAIREHVGGSGDVRLKVVADASTPATDVEPATRSRLIALGRYTPDDLIEIKGQLDAVEWNLDGFVISAKVKSKGGSGAGPCADVLREALARHRADFVVDSCVEDEDDQGHKICVCDVIVSGKAGD